jgi:hypothetical protein
MESSVLILPAVQVSAFIIRMIVIATTVIVTVATITVVIIPAVIVVTITVVATIVIVVAAIIVMVTVSVGVIVVLRLNADRRQLVQHLVQHRTGRFTDKHGFHDAVYCTKTGDS